MEIFVFARLHARPGKRSEVHQAVFEVQGPTHQELRSELAHDNDRRHQPVGGMSCERELRAWLFRQVDS